jgi:hypothetical protein
MDGVENRKCQEIMQTATRETFQRWADKIELSSPGLIPTYHLW